MPKILVVANRTVAGRKVLDAVRERAAGDTEFHLVVPLSTPRHGNVIYDDALRDAAQLRIDLVADFMRNEGIEISGEVGDPDPLTATSDALATFPADEIILSTLPESRSGWLRRDLVDRIREEAGGVPVQHVVTDIDSEGLAVHVTLAVANKTAGGDELIKVLKSQSDRDRDRVFIVLVPQEGGGGRAAGIARQRRNALVNKLRENGLTARGIIGDPDPFDAIKNALDFFTVDEVVISTLPETKSGWLRADLISRVQNVTAAHVEHIVQTETAAV